MGEQEKAVLQKIQGYFYNKLTLQELQEQKEHVTYKITPTYGNVSGAAGGGFSSKVERMGNKTFEIDQRIKKIRIKMALIETWIDYSDLTAREKRLMYWIANNGKLQVFARKEHIGKDNVYKIRDRALKKIIAHHITHNVG